MRNRITRYEVALTNTIASYQNSYLVAYTPRLSRHGLLSAVRQRSADILRVTGLSEAAVATWPDTKTLDLGENGWRLIFTGRTQIECQDRLRTAVHHRGPVIGHPSTFH